MYSIRPGVSRDIEQLAALERACFSAPMTEEQLAYYLSGEGHLFLVAADETDRILGYAGLLYVLDEGDILNVAVSAEHRRLGIADALMAALETNAETLKLSFLTLEVRESNTAAIQLYTKHGYTRVGLRKNYYTKPTENALLLTKYLK